MRSESGKLFPGRSPRSAHIATPKSFARRRCSCTGDRIDHESRSPDRSASQTHRWALLRVALFWSDRAARRVVDDGAGPERIFKEDALHVCAIASTLAADLESKSDRVAVRFDERDSRFGRAVKADLERPPVFENADLIDQGGSPLVAVIATPADERRENDETDERPHRGNVPGRLSGADVTKLLRLAGLARRGIRSARHSG